MIRKAWMMATLIGALLLSTFGAQAELQSTKFRVVGTWSNLNNYKLFEKPFYGSTLPEASGGKVTGDIFPITELGLKGFEVMRLLKQGVFDVAHASYGYTASENPALEGIDLSSVAGSLKEGRAVVNAYAPVIARHLNETFNSHYLYTYPFPGQFIFCSKPIDQATDLKNKKIRVYSTTLGDFVEGAGGISVTLAFAEVVPALQRGVADCGVTGSMAAFQAKWHEIITHALLMRVSAGLAFGAMSNRAWNKLNPETQAFITAQYKKLEDETWAWVEQEDQHAFRCLSGNGECTMGQPGNVTLIEPSAADFAERERILKQFVLKRWASRCGDACVKEWNETAGKVVGVTASK